jgi:hypothetical protein
MSLNLVLFVLVVIFIVGWFAVGTHANVRKGEDALRWLQQGLPLVGEKTTLRWLGSSVVELKLQQAKAPFREAEVLIVLEPRDVALLWWIARLRGRRDLLVFRGTLQRAPRLELVAADPRAWTLGGNDPRVKTEQWSSQSVPPLTVYSPANFTAAASVANLAAINGCPIVRLSVRRIAPNIEVQWRLAEVRQDPSADMIETVLQLVESI